LVVFFVGIHLLAVSDGFYLDMVRLFSQIHEVHAMVLYKVFLFLSWLLVDAQNLLL
jgi:hypothetical protein